MKYFTGLNCDHYREVAEYINDTKFLRCDTCQSVRKVKTRKTNKRYFKFKIEEE